MKDAAVAASTLKRSRSATRERLLDAAGAVFAERGFAASTIEDICDRAGFTRGAFYSNFETKDELLVQLLDREEVKLLKRFNAAVSQALQATEPLAVVVERIYDLQPFGANNYALRAELVFLALKDPKLAAAYQAAREALRAKFGPFLVAALAARGLRLTVDPIDALDTLEAVFEASVRSSLIAGGSANDRGSLAARMLPIIVLAVSEPA